MQVAGLDIHDGAVTNVLLERGEALEGSSEAPGTRIAGVELASGGSLSAHWWAAVCPGRLLGVLLRCPLMPCSN